MPNENRFDQINTVNNIIQPIKKLIFLMECNVYKLKSSGLRFLFDCILGINQTK